MLQNLVQRSAHHINNKDISISSLHCYRILEGCIGVCIYIHQGIITIRPHFIINHLILFVLNEHSFMVFPFEIVQFIGGQ